MYIQNLSHQEKLEQLRQKLNIALGSEKTKEVQIDLQSTINSLLTDLLQDQVVEMKKVGFLKWVQTNPTLAIILFTLVSFGTGISVSDIVTPFLSIFKIFVS